MVLTSLLASVVKKEETRRKEKEKATTWNIRMRVSLLFLWSIQMSITLIYIAQWQNKAYALYLFFFFFKRSWGCNLEEGEIGFKLF